MNPKIRAMLTHPIDVLFRQFLAYTCKTDDGYDAAKYWRARHARYGFDLRGVGNASLSSDENSQQYLHAKETFLALCQQLTRDERRGIYERSRTIEYYHREFQHDDFSEPLPFREKFIFTIRKQ